MERMSPHPEELNLTSARHRLTLGDYPPGPLGIVASTPAPRIELSYPERFVWQPPRTFYPGLTFGPRVEGGTEVFIPPPSPPPGPRIPLFLQNRPVSIRTSLPDVSLRRRDESRLSQPTQFQFPLQPLLFDQIPDRRHTLGGEDGYLWNARQLDTSLPANLNQMGPLMFDHIPDRRHTFGGSDGYRRINRPLDRSVPANLNQMRPLMFDHIPDRRHTFGGSDDYRRINRPLDRSLPLNLNQMMFIPPVLNYDPQFYTTQPVRRVTSYVDPGLDASLPLDMSQVSQRRREFGTSIRRGRSVPGNLHRQQLPGPFAPLSQSLTRRFPASPAVAAGQRTHLPTAIDHLRRKLAEAETRLQIEQMTVNELRAQIDEESRRYEEEAGRAKSLAEEVENYKINIADLEEKNLKLVIALEQEKNRYAYMMKMKNATPEMLAERELEMQMVKEEREKFDHLLDFCEKLEDQVINAEKQLDDLKKSDDYRNAREKLEALEGMETDIDYEQDVAEKLLNEVETEKVINDELAGQLNEEKRKTAVKRQALQNIIDDKARLQIKVDEMIVQLDHYVTKQRQMNDELKDVEYRKRNRYPEPIGGVAQTTFAGPRGGVAQTTFAGPRGGVAQTTFAGPRGGIAQTTFVGPRGAIAHDTSALERENSMLKVQLKQSALQLQALASETPLKLKLNEANHTMQKLVEEKEQLYSQFSHLKEQKDVLNNTLSSLKEENDELRKRLTGSPKIMVTDGCIEDVNAKYASERAAWLKEKEALQNALTRATRSCPVSMSEFNADLHHVLSRYMRAESYRKSLAWQKQYLLVALAGYKEEEGDTIKKLRKFVGPRHVFEEPSAHVNKFKITALAIIGISRMHYLVEHRRNTRLSTYDILHKALTKSKKQLPHNPHPTTQRNSVWHRKEEPLTNRQPLLTPLTPGCVSEYMERFNEMQNRIRLTLASNNT